MEAVANRLIAEKQAEAAAAKTVSLKEQLQASEKARVEAEDKHLLAQEKAERIAAENASLKEQLLVHQQNFRGALQNLQGLCDVSGITGVSDKVLTRSFLQCMVCR